MVHFAMKYLFLMVGSCGASYLRDATPMARELQSLPTIDDIILTDSNLTTLAAAFEAAQLVDRLCTTCNFTAFAPTNDAFAAIDQEFLTTLLTPSWILHLQNLLAFHITLPTDDGNRLLSTSYVDGQIFEMLNSEQVTVRDLKSGIKLTSPLTVGSKIVEADILASNGVVQKVDTVLSPGFFGVDVFALGDSFVEFTILQELMDLIGLRGTEGEFTVLAPVNEAFLALGNDTLAALKEDKEALGKILANHVIVGVYPSMFLANGLVLESLGGLNITVTVSAAIARQLATTIMFNDATVILADILAKNGIVHAIDTVLIDPDPASDVPSILPSDVPSDAPSSIPSDVPSSFPSSSPNDMPSDMPGSAPTAHPTTSSMPSDLPSTAPSLSKESVVPSHVPSSTPSDSPSDAPSDMPSSTPSDVPSSTPSEVPSDSPSDSPSASPSVSVSPSASPNDSTAVKRAPNDTTTENGRAATTSMATGKIGKDKKVKDKKLKDKKVKENKGDKRYI